MSAEFVDTNVFVYAYDPEAGEKHHIARDLVSRLWVDVSGRISTQVLQELYASITRKTPRLSPSAALDLVEELSAWPVYAPAAGDVLSAVRRAIQHSLSIWDSMIIQAALASGCSTLWSEDLQNERKFESLVIRNPFR